MTACNLLYFCFLLASLFDLINPKGTVRFGSARVLIAQQDEDGELNFHDHHSHGADSDPFNLKFYVPTSSVARPSEDFEKYAAGAGKAFLVGSSSRNALYFAPEGYVYDEEWVAGDQVCQANVFASQLRSDRFHFADPHQLLTVHFLCDFHCCRAQCCELNYSLLCIVGLIFTTMTATIFWVVWLRYHHRCACLPRPFEVAASRLLGKKVRRHYHVRLTPDLEVIATRAMMTEPKVYSLHSTRLPLF